MKLTCVSIAHTQFCVKCARSITNVRETRITGIASHILILASLLLIPYPIAYIPTAVLSGLFLYMAVTSLDGLQIFERLMLLFTEQVSVDRD